MDHDEVANLFRAVTIMLGAMCAGAMFRFYWSRRTPKGMPSWATIAVALLIFEAMYSSYENWNNPWNWIRTPVSLIAFLCVIAGVWPYLRPKGFKSKDER